MTEGQKVAWYWIASIILVVMVGYFAISAYEHILTQITENRVRVAELAKVDITPGAKQETEKVRIELFELRKSVQDLEQSKYDALLAMLEARWSGIDGERDDMRDRLRSIEEWIRTHPQGNTRPRVKPPSE